MFRKELMSVSEVPNYLEGNTISNRGAYSTKERMPSDRNPPLPSASLEGCTWLALDITFRDVLPSRQYKDYEFQSPHILVSLVCTGLLIVLPSRQFQTPETYIALFFSFITSLWSVGLRQISVFFVFKNYLCVSASLRFKNIIFWAKFSGHRR